MQSPSLAELLKKMTEMGGSDLHLATGAPPHVRVDGRLRPLRQFPPLTSEDTRRLAYSVLTPNQKQQLEEHLELDFSFGIEGLARFRGNCFSQRGAVGAVFRGIPFRVRSFDDLNLPAVLKTFCRKSRGLILVTGATGSGKSTTLAAMIDQINCDRHAHILTIEDPHRVSARPQELPGQPAGGSLRYPILCDGLASGFAPGPRRGAAW